MTASRRYQEDEAGLGTSRASTSTGGITVGGKTRSKQGHAAAPEPDTMSGSDSSHNRHEPAAAKLPTTSSSSSRVACQQRHPHQPGTSKTSSSKKTITKPGTKPDDEGGMAKLFKQCHEDARRKKYD